MGRIMVIAQRRARMYYIYIYMYVCAYNSDTHPKRNIVIYTYITYVDKVCKVKTVPVYVLIRLEVQEGVVYGFAKIMYRYL